MKTNNKTFITVFLIVFVTIEIVLGINIQFSDNLPYRILTLSSIAIAVLGATLFFKPKTNYFIMLIALVCTLCADFFLSELVIFDNVKIVAMSFFSITQICYFLRLYLNQKSTKSRIIHLITRFSITIIALVATIIVLKETTNALALISLFYFANLLMNIIVAFTQFRQAPLFAIGLFLFSCCDIIVGLLQLEHFLPIPEDSFIYKLNEGPIILAWFFYVPSQTCIVCDVALQSTKN